MAKKKTENEAKYQRNILASPEPVKKITFKAWFINKLGNDRRLKQHHFDQIHIFMAGLNLKDEEPAKAYEDGLKVYFGK